jgi:hypothetical protein
MRARGRHLGQRSRAVALRRWAAAGLFAAIGIADSRAADDDGQPLQAQVKAAYLYKFAGYVEWPPSAFADATAPFTIGVVGAVDIADELNKLKSSRSVNDHPIEVHMLKPGDPARGIQLVFVGRTDAAQLRRVLDGYRNLPILTISDVPGAVDAGCVINFVMVDKRIRFEISLGNAERQGLKVSARLLAVAQRVDTGRP